MWCDMMISALLGFRISLTLDAIGFTVLTRKRYLIYSPTPPAILNTTSRPLKQRRCHISRLYYPRYHARAYQLTAHRSIFSLEVGAGSAESALNSSRHRSMLSGETFESVAILISGCTKPASKANRAAQNNAHYCKYRRQNHHRIPSSE